MPIFPTVERFRHERAVDDARVYVRSAARAAGSDEQDGGESDREGAVDPRNHGSGPFLGVTAAAMLRRPGAVRQSSKPAGWTRGGGRRENPCVTASIAIALALLTIVRLSGPSAARADVVPGDVITKANAEKVKDLTSPGLYWCVQHGLPMRIIEHRDIKWPPAYREATEKYSTQVKLAKDGLHLEGYVAGAPSRSSTRTIR